MTYLHRLFGPLYRSADAVAKAILGSRLHFLLSGHFIVIEFTGLRTGMPYRVGLTYRQHGNTLHSMTHRRRLWWGICDEDARLRSSTRASEYRQPLTWKSATRM